MALSRRS